MAYVRIPFFLSAVFTYVLALTIARPAMLYKSCVERGNYTTNSAYQQNLKHLLNSIYTNTEINFGFYNFSFGENLDRVSAIALCRPDISPDVCRGCIKDTSDSLLTSCSNFKEAVGGYDNCMLRYANRSIFNQMEAGPYFWVYGPTNVSDVAGFNKSRMDLLDMLSDKAASSSDSRYKYATGNISAPNSQNIYALVQCTPDLSTQQCKNCLAQATNLIPQCCSERAGGRVITPSCNFRYETGLFYAPTAKSEAPSPISEESSPSPTSPPPTSTSARKGKASNMAGALIIGALPMLLY